MSTARDRVIGFLSILPLVYIVAFSFLLTWWFTSFEPSKVTNARAVVVGFWSVFAIHLLMMALIFALLVYFCASLRGAALADAQKVAWAVALVVLNVLAYPFFYFFVIRPTLAAGSRVQERAG